MAVHRRTVLSGDFDPASILALIAGLFYVVMGIIVLIDTGLSGFPDQPVTETFRLTHTPLLGAIDIAVGLLLVLGAVGFSRPLISFGAALLVIGGAVIVAAWDRLPAALTTEKAYGWLALIAGAVLLLASMLLPSFSSRRQVYDRDYETSYRAE